MNDIHLPFRLLHQLRASEQASAARPSLRRASRLLTLEQRFMFDGAAVATAADAAHAQADTHAAALAAEAAAAAHQVRAAEATQNNGKKEVVFVDTSVANYKTLEAGVGDGIAIVEFDGSKDGLAQIAQWAANQSGYDAIHILSHGSDGTLNLGTTVLTDASLASGTVQAELTDIGHALNAGGDLLLYGCDVAAGSDGQRFIDDLARLTGADVAASTDATGSVDKGGNWTLEAHAGDIDARALHITDYQGLLTVVTFTGSDADYSSMTVTKTINGQNVTFTGGTGFGGLGIDGSYATGGGNDGLYAYEGTNGGNDIKLTLSINPGYMFDVSSFDTGVSSGSLTIAMTYANGTTDSFTLNSLNNAWQTLSGFSKSLDHVTQVVLSSSDFGLFQNFNIINVRAIPPVPVVTDANISIISSPTGLSSTYKIGDTVTATWTNAAASEVDKVTMNFSQFGGGSAVAATNSGGVWTASYTITSGSIDAAGRNVSVSAINAGGSATVADTTNLSVDNAAPTVTDARIGISGGSGTGGAYKVGDTVTATWNNTAGGDNNTDTLSSVTFDFSAFGGGSTVAATNSGGTWTATYTITAGAIDATNRNVSVKVTDNAGNATTTADTTNATVDNIAPTVTDANISISGGSGTGGAYKVGDTVTATWNNTAGGDNNSDTLAGVTFDLSQFGGGSAVAATNSGGIWTATYTIVAGAIDGATGRNVSVRVVDNAGNATTTGDTTNATVDNVRPTTVFSGVALSSDTGTSSTDFVTKTAAQTITATLSAGLNGGDIVYGSLDNGVTWTDITSKVSGTTLTWTGATLVGSNTLKVKVTDAAGNDGTAASQAYTLDTTAPAAPSMPDLTAASDTGISSVDNITQSTTPTFTGTAESGATVTLYDTDGTTVLGTTTAAGGNWSITTSNLVAGSHTITAKASDAAGNTSAASAGLTITIDTTAPTGFGLSATTIPSLSASSGSGIATLSSTDGLAVTYSLVAGNGTNDANNGSFSIAGNSLQVGASSLTAGTYKIYLAATDAAGNVSNQAFTLTVVDAPSVTSIVRTGGASGTVNTSATTISYTVTFSESVSGVDIGDFTLTSAGSATGHIANVAGSGTTYTVTVDTLSGEGTLRLDLNGSGTGIQNGGSVAIVGGYAAGATYTLDHIAPAAPSAPDMTSGTDTGTSSVDNITRNTTPTFTGTAESGATVTLYDTDGTTVLGTTTATGGTWSITSSTLSAGTHTVTAKATDAAGNVSSASSGLNVTIDTSPPTLTISSNVSTLKAGETATITFTFSEDPGSTFTWDGSSGDIVVSGGTLSAISGSGLTRTATFTPTANTNAGTASITVAAGSYTDVAGNNGGAGLTPALTFDTLAPGTPSPAAMTSASDTGASNTDNITSNATPTFTGNAEAGALVTLYDTDGITVLGTGIATGGNWSITTSHLGEGDHAIKVVVTDAAGNASNASAPLNITVDTTPPPSVSSAALSADTGISGSDFITRTAAQTISGTLSANLGSMDAVEVSLDNGATWNTATSSTGSNAWSYTGTLNGSAPIQVRVVDRAGNASAVYSQAYTLDTVAPEVNSVSVPADGTYYNAQNLDFTVHFSEAVTVDTSGGTPRIALAIGVTVVYAYYESGSGTNDLLFRYTVASGNQDGNGITVGALNVNGGAIRDTAGNDATTTLNSLGSTALVNVDGNLPQVIDVNSPTPDGGYKAGDTVSITLTFSKAVTVDTAGGTPSLSLNNGGTASYASGSGGTTLTFTYTVSAGQDTADLDYSAASALVLNGGAIKDSSGAHMDAVLSLSAPGASGSLGANKAIVIDTTPPTQTFSGLALSADTGASPSDFITRIASQTISATLSSVLTGGDKIYGSLDNGATWTDITSKLSGTSLSWDGVALSGSGTLLLKVADSAGNDGPIARQNYEFDNVAAAPSRPSMSGGADTGVSDSDGITRNTAPTFTGTAEAGSTVTIYDTDGATVLGTTTATADGRWSVASAVLSEGAHTITAKIVDTAGNVSNASAGLSVVIDTTAPAAPAVDPVDAKTLAPVLTGSATLAAGETLTINVGGASYLVTPDQGRWSLDLASAVSIDGARSTLAAGSTYNVTATVTDAAGNASSATGVLKMTAVAPPPPVVNPPNPSAPEASRNQVAAPVTGEPNAGQAAMPPFVPPSLAATLGNLPVGVGADPIAASLLSLVRASSSNGLSDADRFNNATLTQGSSFRVVVMAASSGVDGLMLNRGMEDQGVQASRHVEISIPPDAFAHTDPNAAIELAARQANGQPLPGWIRFDSKNGKFIIDAPSGMRGEIAIRVTARDAAGHEVVTIFRVRVGEQAAQSLPQAGRDGRAGLSEQIHQAARQRSNGDALERLAQLSNAFRWPNP